ncbi:DNA helicase INO80-like isoform X2 [Acanthaster planci]|uniref:Chromatin-remodeling ATPase INO80 n=1 Tax=Acanthaster planci TaxID=133434 RepID=A0A8B7XR03_ACAPL|nr:DNA helicase INO80-like isoform X2 [Acanthaster planci]
MSEGSKGVSSDAVLPEGPVGGVPQAKPLHIQRLEKAVCLEPYLAYVEKILTASTPEHGEEELYKEEVGRDAVPPDDEALKEDDNRDKDVKTVHGLITSRAERKADRRRLYNLSKVKKSRRWLKNILLSDSSDSSAVEEEDEDKPLSQEELKEMIQLHRYKRQCQSKFYTEGELQQYQYYSTGLLSSYDNFLDHKKLVLGPKQNKEKQIKKEKEKLKKVNPKPKKKVEAKEKPDIQVQATPPALVSASTSVAHFQDALNHKKLMAIKDVEARRRRVWHAIIRKDIPKAQKHRMSVHNNILTNARKLAQACQKEQRRRAIASQRVCKETPHRARRMTREMTAYWRHYDKVEKEHRKKAEKEAQEQRRLDDEMREARRQQRKLNFLITQTELYAHFMSRKLTGEGEEQKERILSRLEDHLPKRQVAIQGGVLVDVEEDDYDCDFMKQQALSNVSFAYTTHQEKQRVFDGDRTMPDTSVSQQAFDKDFSLSNPAMLLESERAQPAMFRGQLKSYQLKGMNWLANLYDCSINGILADEMGLGKTVQSIGFLAHLAESQGIWGPFLIVAPASTLHNWQQECARFVPGFKVLPYWGNPQERRILRKFWSQRPLQTTDSEFHILITSYQLVIQDIKYFQRIKWHYMILDEAQAIKSSSSVRWKLLLQFSCRNRLLLTGTPIQNSMAELWALLHFIMPTLFDSHEEFNEWFSKDIESHAERQSGINEEQLSRLHMILKPFMLRRVKKDVENELSDKIEILVYCHLTTRQRLFYQALRNKISIEDLLQSSSSSAASSTTSQSQSTANSLMNLVMQFRKVCNHPELFERRDTRSPFYCQLDPPVHFVPRLIYQDGMVDRLDPTRNKLLRSTFSVFAPDYIHASLSPSTSRQARSSCFSFARFVDLSPAQLHGQLVMGLMARWLALFLVMKSAYRVHHACQWGADKDHARYLGRHGLILWPRWTTSPPSVASSPALRDLVFTGNTSGVVAHPTQTYYFMPETPWHRRVRLSKAGQPDADGESVNGDSGTPDRSSSWSPRSSSSPRSPRSPRSPAAAKRVRQGGSSHSVGSLLSASGHFLPIMSDRPSAVRVCSPTELPAFICHYMPKVLAPPLGHYCSHRQAEYDHRREELGGSLDAWLCALHGSPDCYQDVQRGLLFPLPRAGLSAVRPHHGWSKIQIPDKQYLVTDSGKMYVLDELLTRLKREGHRVLIYSQMTRMIDLLEEFMWHRKHTYMRLDGSSKISDRRDMVADFQSRSDIFVFLLSTRAGGLGINLTAADTVIFYDSDWNPTVDQQAMDRAHRLGQTKQVTVYRLICKGTIEEKILQRAREKSEIQRMVITGGQFKPEQLKPKEVVSLLLDDEEIERKFHEQQREKKLTEERNRARDRKRKREKYAEMKKEAGKKLKADGVPGTPLGSLVSDGASVSLDGEDSLLSMDSGAPSPLSVVSVGSETQRQAQSYTPVSVDENSNDGLVIADEQSADIELDDSARSHQPGSGKRGPSRGGKTTPSPGTKRIQARPGRVRKGTGAAAIAGARAGAVAGTAAAYAAYGFSFKEKSNSALAMPGDTVGTTVSPHRNSNPSPSPVPSQDPQDVKAPTGPSPVPSTSSSVSSHQSPRR